MQAHINPVYALLATSPKQRVLYLLVDRLGTFLWRLVLRIALGHHTPHVCLGRLALGCNWTYLVLLRVSLSHVNGPCQHHSDAIITVGHVTSTLKQPFPIACYIVMDTQMSAMERDAIDQQSIYIHCGYTHLVADITLCLHIFILIRLHSSSCRGLSILVFLHFHKLLQHNIP